MWSRRRLWVYSGFVLFNRASELRHTLYVLVAYAAVVLCTCCTVRFVRDLALRRLTASDFV